MPYEVEEAEEAEDVLVELLLVEEEVAVVAGVMLAMQVEQVVQEELDRLGLLRHLTV
jgi:hypothetical protein